VSRIYGQEYQPRKDIGLTSVTYCQASRGLLPTVVPENPIRVVAGLLSEEFVLVNADRIGELILDVRHCDAKVARFTKVCAHFGLGQSTQTYGSENLSRAAIAMMQPADLRNRDHLALFRWLNIACNRRVSIQRQVRAGVMVVVERIGEHSSEVALVEHDDMIEAFVPDGADDSLDAW